MKSSHKLLAGRILPVVFIVLGGLSVWAAYHTLANGWASESWPSVDGIVIESKLDSSTQSNGAERESTTTYFPHVTYNYTVNGDSFDGYEIAFSGYSSTDRSEVEAVLARYPVNQVVTVYYNPDKPNRSVLEPGVRAFPYGFLLGGVLFVGVGFWMMRKFSRR